MRNIEDYTKNYLIENFEDYQIRYRKKKLIEILDFFGLSGKRYNVYNH